MRWGRAPREAFSHCDSATAKSVAHCAKLRVAEMPGETAYGTDRCPSRAQADKSVQRPRDTVVARRRRAMRHAHAIHRMRCAHQVDMSPTDVVVFCQPPSGAHAAVDESRHAANA